MFTFVEVHDLANGIALAAEKGNPGETYLLCGESKSLKEHFAIWAKKPGAYKISIWLPPRLAAFFFWPLEPLLRAMSLPAFLSRETVWAGSSNLNYSSEKAIQELGWTHVTAEEMWFSAIDWELEVLPKRKSEKLISRLKPMDLETM
jgi:dihydroflavonol-4-reductase